MSGDRFYYSLITNNQYPIANIQVEREIIIAPSERHVYSNDIKKTILAPSERHLAVSLAVVFNKQHAIFLLTHSFLQECIC